MDKKIKKYLGVYGRDVIDLYLAGSSVVSIDRSYPSLDVVLGLGDGYFYRRLGNDDNSYISSLFRAFVGGLGVIFDDVSLIRISFSSGCEVFSFYSPVGGCLFSITKGENSYIDSFISKLNDIRIGYTLGDIYIFTGGSISDCILKVNDYGKGSMVIK